MSADREKRRQDLRAEVVRLMKVQRCSAPAEFGMYELVDHVVGILIDTIADLDGRVEDLESRLFVFGVE